MSIDGVASYADYSDSSSDGEMQYFDELGVEWQGRNILDVRDDICIKSIRVFAQVYEQTARTDPSALPQIKAEIIELLEHLFVFDDEDEAEENSLLYRFDPISGTYREIIGAEGGFIKSIVKGLKKAKKVATKAVRETGRWVRENPVETVAIAAAVVVVIVTAGTTAGAFAGAGAAAAGATSDNDHKKDQNKDSQPASSPPPTQNTSSPVSNDPISSQPIITTPIQDATPQIFSPSNPLAQDLFRHSTLQNPYEQSAASADNPSAYPSSLGPANSLTPEYRTYSPPASPSFIPHSSSYKPPSTPPRSVPNLSLPIASHSQKELSSSLQHEIGSNAFYPSGSPWYQEMHKPGFSPTSGVSQKQNISDISKTSDLADFTNGVSKGFPRGCLDSVLELPSTLASLAKLTGNYVLAPFIHPLNHLPGQKSISQAMAVYETISYLRTCEDGEVSRATGELIKAAAPEAHKLFTDWDNLSIEERGDLSAYCVGKYGTDFLLPIAAAKGAKVVGGVFKEAGAAGKFESIIGAASKEAGAANTSLKSLNLANFRELIKAGGNTQILAKELGFTNKNIANLTKTGTLDTAVVNAFENIIRDKAMLESLEKFKAAEDFFKSYRGQYLSEIQARELIHQTGIRTYPRPTGIPENYVVKISNNGVGIKYIDPQNIHISIRVMPGKPHSPFPHQREPYVIHTKHGNTLDKSGNVVSSDSPAAHIPVNEFDYRQ